MKTSSPGKANAPTKKRVRRSPDEAKRLILEAAIRVLSLAGPNAVGLKEVAAEAKVSHALVTHYFGTYDALVEACVFECMAKLRERFVERVQNVKETTPEALVYLYLDTALEPWYGRLVSWALLTEHEGAADYADRMQADMKLIAAASQQVLADRLHPAPTRSEVEALIVAVWSMSMGYIIGNSFFWRSLGRKPGRRRNNDLRKAVGALARAMFG